MSSGAGERLRLGRAVGLALVGIYRFTLAPLLGGQCRFAPSCSRYAEQALSEHGVWRGLYLAVRRIARCHPWHPGGIDEVPPALPYRIGEEAGS